MLLVLHPFSETDARVQVETWNACSASALVILCLQTWPSGQQASGTLLAFLMTMMSYLVLLAPV